MPSREDWLSVGSSHLSLTPVIPMGPPASPDPATPPPLPPMPADKKHGTPKGKKALTGGSIATLLESYQQSHSHNASLGKNTPAKDTPAKDIVILNKKNLTPNRNGELPKKSNIPAPPAVSERVTLIIVWTVERMARASTRRGGRRRTRAIQP